MVKGFDEFNGIEGIVSVSDSKDGISIWGLVMLEKENVGRIMGAVEGMIFVKLIGVKIETSSR